MSYFDAVVLRHDGVRLEPLADRHHDDLVDAVAVGELWRAWYTTVPSPQNMRQAIEDRRGLHADRRMVPWAVIDERCGRAVGMTAYLNPDPDNRRLEVGATWLGKHAQQTVINPTTKLLLLTRAFEQLDCIAVEFRTHWHNRQSRAAIERLGAKQDGVLRNHIILDNGTIRDTVVYSIVEAEWPTVKLGLTRRVSEALNEPTCQTQAKATNSAGSATG